MKRNARTSLEQSVDLAAAKSAPTRTNLSEAFRRGSSWIAWRMGSHWAFLVALAIIIGWALTGPIFRYSDTWQLVINTGTTIVTFLMVFIIQSTQNRDARAFHLKLDELIRATRARNAFAALENASDQELDELQKQFERLRSDAQGRKSKSKS